MQGMLFAGLITMLTAHNVYRSCTRYEDIIVLALGVDAAFAIFSLAFCQYMGIWK